MYSSAFAREDPKVCQVVTIGMEGKDCRHGTGMQLSLYVVPTICEPLVSQPISTCVKENEHLVASS